MANLNGRKAGLTVVIEGFQGRFREITSWDWPDFEDGIFDDSPEYLLNHIYRWFELADMNIYNQDPTTVVGGRAIRIFTHMSDNRVLPIEAVAERMIDELGCDPGGWRDPLLEDPRRPFVSMAAPGGKIYESLAMDRLLESYERRGLEQDGRKAAETKRESN